jgi:hypothetical protein
MDNKFYSFITSVDGFGAQYQKIIQTYIYCKMHNLNFLYHPFKEVEHNYDNDDNYINKLENLINLKDNIQNIENHLNVNFLDYNLVIRDYVENNIDKCCESEDMNFIKKCFWENKSTNFFNNNKINTAIHIRRDNICDRGDAGSRTTTPNSYYLNIMNDIREKYKDKDKELLFHIYSQGDLDLFKDLENSDVTFYLNHDIVETFIGMVSANILVISPSSFSYIAALLSDGEIYYKPFWHNPKNNWNYK